MTPRNDPDDASSPDGTVSGSVSAHAERERAIIDKIRQGLDDMRAGRVVPHAEVMRCIRKTIEEAAAKRQR